MTNLELHNNLLNSFKAFVGSHFMFNVMNTIQSDLLLKRDKEAFQTLQIFNRLYKHAVRSSNEQLIALADEVDHLNQYLAMEHLRFGNRKFPRSISCGSLKPGQLIPSFVLQSLVENAVLMSLEDRNHRGFNVVIQQEASKIKLQIQLSLENETCIHPKVESKISLALQRLEELQNAGLINFHLSWEQACITDLEIDLHET